MHDVANKLHTPQKLIVYVDCLFWISSRLSRALTCLVGISSRLSSALTCLVGISSRFSSALTCLVGISSRLSSALTCFVGISSRLSCALTCLVGVGASKEHAEAVLAMPVAAHALLKHVCLHDEVRKGSIAADGQGQSPQRLPLLAGAASWAQQQPGNWPTGLLP